MFEGCFCGIADANNGDFSVTYDLRRRKGLEGALSDEKKVAEMIE